MADGVPTYRGIRMHAMPSFCFPHGTAEDGAGIAGRLALWRAVWRGAGLILLRSRCVAFGDRATEERARCPQYGCGVRTWSVWVHVGPIGCPFIVDMHDLYTIRLVPTPSERLSIPWVALFIGSFASSRIAPGSCSAQLKVAPCEMALRSSGRNCYPDSSPISWSFIGKFFSSAAWQVDEFGIVGRCRYPDTSGHHLPWRHIGREVKTLPHLHGYSCDHLVSYRLIRALRSAAEVCVW
jgi:hypothetical protein